jgi:hypothetical protein
MARTQESPWATASRIGLVTGAALGVLFGAAGIVPIVVAVPAGAALGLVVGSVAGLQRHPPGRHAG